MSISPHGRRRQTLTLTLPFLVTIFQRLFFSRSPLSESGGYLIWLNRSRHYILIGALVAVWYSCRICNREVAGSNLGLGYFAPRSTQPSIPPGSVNEYQLMAGKAKAGMAHSIIADERVGVQVNLWDPLRTDAISERFWGGVHKEALYQVYIPLPLYSSTIHIQYTAVHRDS